MNGCNKPCEVEGHPVARGWSSDKVSASPCSPAMEANQAHHEEETVLRSPNSGSAQQRIILDGSTDQQWPLSFGWRPASPVVGDMPR